MRAILPLQEVPQIAEINLVRFWVHHSVLSLNLFYTVSTPHAAEEQLVVVRARWLVRTCRIDGRIFVEYSYIIHEIRQLSYKPQSWWCDWLAVGYSTQYLTFWAGYSHFNQTILSYTGSYKLHSLYDMVVWFQRQRCRKFAPEKHERCAVSNIRTIKFSNCFGILIMNFSISWWEFSFPLAVCSTLWNTVVTHGSWQRYGSACGSVDPF